MAADDGWENKKDDIEEGVEDFPENTAHWTGEKVRHPTLFTTIELDTD